jgi:hypothetical protein
MKRPCPHIAPAIEPLLNEGAIFTDVIPGSSEYKFIHHLNKGATPQHARDLAKTNNIEYWVNNDSHYESDCGFSCSKCRLAVSWLQKDGVINAI